MLSYKCKQIQNSSVISYPDDRRWDPPVGQQSPAVRTPGSERLQAAKGCLCPPFCQTLSTAPQSGPGELPESHRCRHGGDCCHDNQSQVQHGLNGNFKQECCAVYFPQNLSLGVFTCWASATY